MKTYYANDGKPDGNGRLCLIIDMEDGRPVPQRVYGATIEEINTKLAGMYGNAAARLTEVKREAEQAGVPTRRQNDSNLPPASPKTTTLTAGDRIQKTHELSSPEKSGAAVRALIEDELGGSLEDVKDIVQRDRQRRLADQTAELFRTWADDNPDFPQHPINRTMVANRAALKAGSIHAVTHAILDETYEELQEQGLLIPAEVPAASTAPVEDHTPQAVGTARTRTATSVRRQELTARPGVQATRWTDQQIAAAINGPDAEYRRLVSDPTFRAAVDAYTAKNRKRAG
jgi:hypothetical protein